MAQKSQDNRVFPVGTRDGDIAAGAAGALLGVLLSVWVFQPPWVTDWPWARPAEPTAAVVFAWVLTIVGYCGFGFFTGVLIRFDLREHRLPNGLLLWVTGWVFGLLSASSLIRGDGLELLKPWVTTVLVFVIWATAWLLVRVLGAAVGAGDLKLLPATVFAAVWSLPGEAWGIGWAVFGAIVVFGALVFGLIARIRGKAEFAFGPVLLGASWLMLVAAGMPADILFGA